MVLVGAINVGCIETVWHGVVNPPTRHDITTWHYGNVNLARRGNGPLHYAFDGGGAVWAGVMELSESLHAGSTIQMGQLLGKTTVKS